MNVLNRNVNNIFFIFILSHLIIWTLIPSLTNNNLPLDTVEKIAWGNSLDWGFSKHPPVSPFFADLFYDLFGPQDWAFYLLSQLFVITSFYYVFKLSNEILKNSLLSLISVLLLESIFFYNFTTPEFNVNICQLPFWSLTVYYSWKIFENKKIKTLDCILIGLFAALGFLSKYLFIYLIASITLFFAYSIFYKKIKKFDFKYLISIEVFIILLVPHLIWLYNNEFVSILYGIKRTGLEVSENLDHLKYPIIFLIKQLGILIPFLLLISFLIKKTKLKFNIKDKKMIFLIFVNILPIFLILITSIILGSKIRTMWMTPFYLFFGLFFVYVLQSQINTKKIGLFVCGFFFFFILSPTIYSYISITQTDKRTDYPGREIANKAQITWDKNFNKEIEFVSGDEWKAGNLSYHLKSRPKWIGPTSEEILNNSSQFICIDDVCLGRY